MRKQLMSLLAVLILVLAAVPALAQDSGEDAGDFTTLLAALDAAGLTETLAEEGPFTIFAPTDSAFEAALAELDLTAEELLADTDTLTDILLYHVIEGEVMAEDVVALVEDGGGSAEVETLNGATFTVELVDGVPVINGNVNVFATDVPAANGVIHVIDGVLLPPTEEATAEATEEAMDEPMAEATDEAMAEATEEAMTEAAAEEQDSIFEIGLGNPDLTTLLAAAQQVGFGDTLNTEGPLTLFAPTNAAFEAALAELGLTADELLADTDLLTEVLSFHVVEGELFAADILEQAEMSEDPLEVETLGGELLTVEVEDGELLLNGQGIGVTTADIDAENGVIHIIDGVLLPPSLQ